MKLWVTIGLAVAVMAAVLVGIPPGSPVQAASGPPVAVDIEFTANETGQYMLDSYGRVSTFGAAPYFGGSPSLRPAERAVSISPTPSGLGYWIFTDLGRVFTYGDAGNFGDLDHLTLDGPVLDSVPTPSGLGYYMLGNDGGIFAFGDAGFFGSIPGILPPGTELAGKIVGLAPTPTARGYWLVAEDGGMFSFGDATFFGSIPGVLPPGTVLDKPVVGMVPQGQGYLMVAADGGIFSFGQSVFHGSIPGLPDPGARVQSSAQEVVAVMVRSDNTGYIMLGGNGQIWAFGSAQAQGTPDVSTPPNPGDAVNCSDFTTQVDAQKWHDWRSPFYGDVARLDVDGDGLVCESLAASPAQKIVSSDGNLTIDVPKGAAPPGVTVTVSAAPAGVFGPNQIGSAYRLGPDGTTFAGAVTITLRVPSIPTNVQSQALQLGLRSSAGEITGLSTRLAAHPEGGFVLTSATNHFTDVGVVPDSLPLDPGLMQLTCSTDGGPPTDCTQGPLFVFNGQQVTIERTGGLAGPGQLNLSSTRPGDVLLDGNTGFGCEQAGHSFLTAAAATVPRGLPVTPFTHLLVACSSPGVTDTLFADSPGIPFGQGAPQLDSYYLGRTAGGGFQIGIQPGAPTGPGDFGALFVDNPTTGGVEAFTTRGHRHTGPNIGDVGSQVFNNQGGVPLPNEFDVVNTQGSAEFLLPPSAGGWGIIRAESTSSSGFDSDPMSVKVADSIAGQLGSRDGGQDTACLDSETTLCLQGDRFKVGVAWNDGQNSGDGSVINPGFEGGLFYFSDPGNAELVVRLLDGCSAFNRFWVFAAGLTDVEYDLTVTDTNTGREVQYRNSLGSPSPSVIDTSAFATCP